MRFPLRTLNNREFLQTHIENVFSTWDFVSFRFSLKVQKTLAPAPVLSAGAVAETVIEQVSNDCSRNSKVLVCLVQQFPLSLWSFCSLGLLVAHSIQIPFSAGEVVLGSYNGPHWFNMAQNGQPSWLPDLSWELPFWVAAALPFSPGLTCDLLKFTCWSPHLQYLRLWLRNQGA